MAKFKTVANETQARYGYKRKLAVLLILDNVLIVRTIAIHKAMISTKANVGFLSPKKIIDQIKFRESWTQKTEGTFLFTHTKYREIPMRI